MGIAFVERRHTFKTGLAQPVVEHNAVPHARISCQVALSKLAKRQAPAQP